MDVQLKSPKGDLSVLIPSGEWKVIDFPATREEVDFGLENPFIFMEFTLHLVRYQKYGMVNFILPCLLVCVLALLVFLLPPDSGEKIGLSITVLLTLVVFLEILGDETPSTPDTDPIPVVASFFVCTMLMVCASCILAVLNLYFHHRNVSLQVEMGPVFRHMFLVILPFFVRMNPPGRTSPPSFSEFFGKKDESFYTSELVPEHRMEDDNISSPNSQTKLTNSRMDTINSRDNQNIGQTRITSQPVLSRSSSFERSSQEIDYHLKFEPQNSVEARAILLIGRNLLQELEKLTDHLESQAVTGAKVDDWKFAAMVLDRVFLYVFSVLMMLAMSMTILTSPGLYSDPVAAP